MDQHQHVSTQQTPMFAHQQQQAATFAERVQSWFGSPHPQQQTAPQIGQLDARAALHGGQEAIKRVPNLEKRELELCVLDLTPRLICSHNYYVHIYISIQNWRAIIFNVNYNEIT